MKLLLSILVLFAMATSALATEQVPDIIEYEGEICELDASWQYPSPLEVYFRSSGKKSPFEELNTGNYRGHIATWKVANGILYLVEVKKEEAVVDLATIFPDAKAKGEIEASWFHGIVWVKTGRHKKEYADGTYSIEYTNWVFLRFIEGRLFRKQVLTNKQYWKAVGEYFDRRETDNPVKEGPIFEYAEYIKSFE